MAHTLTIHNPPNPNLQDWDLTREIGASEVRGIQSPTQSGTHAKVATSIPTPFARLHLFETGLEIVKENHNGNSPYHKLVSNLLDFLQLMFDKGNDKEYLSFRKWHKESEIDAMLNSDKEGHNLLGKSLKMFFEGEERFKALNEIYLIYYRGILMGGTSPLTLLYTAPSWDRERKGAGLKISSSGDRDLFSDGCEPLHGREEEFQMFLFHFRLAFASKLDGQANALLDYIRRTGERYSKALYQSLPDTLSEQEFAAMYDSIGLVEGQNDVLQAGGVAIRQRKSGSIKEAVISNSDFKLAPTVDHFRTLQTATGGIEEVHVPLALVSSFNGPLKYIQGIWKEKTEVMDVPAIPLHQRELPGKSGMKYPYITVGDFLEETLLQIPFKLNREYFYAGAHEDVHFLLPIKKNYFNFFTLEDLKANFRLEKTMGADGQKIKEVKVFLKVPLQNDTEYNTITFSRTYVVNPGKDSKDGSIKNINFNLGIFPFYKVVDQPELNRYQIMQVDEHSKAPKLNFYRFDGCREGSSLGHTQNGRSPKNKAFDRSIYYGLEESFDLIQVDFEDVSGVIIPMMQSINNAEQNTRFLFSIDFGTTNTYIAGLAENHGSTETFKITPKDLQMVLLNEPNKRMQPDQGSPYDDGFGDMRTSRTLRNREFVPSLIGGEGATFSYPVRTAVCESVKFGSSNPEVLANVNIGFSVDTEDSALNGNQFVTNIKWGFESQRDQLVAENRVYAYFVQTLWMLKNKILLNQGNLHETMISYLLPLSMNRNGKSEYRKIWKRAFAEIFGGAGNAVLKEEAESVVPFYELRERYAFYKEQDALNIDIGGGTTDLLFFSNSTQEYLSTSFRFAGNDIWGDGLTDTKKQNGIFSMMNEKVNKDQISLEKLNLRQYHTLRNSPQFGSEDLIAFMFKHDRQFALTKTLKGHNDLRIVLFLHLAGIIWHVSKYIDHHDLEIPLYMTFTGKGSEYLKIISEDEKDLRDLIKLMLSQFSKKQSKHELTIRLPENPKEITARGGVLKLKEEAEKNHSQSIKPEVKHYLGFEEHGISVDVNPVDVTISNLSKYLSAAETEFDKFLAAVIDSAEIRRFLTELEIRLSVSKFDLKDFMKQQSHLSFQEMVRTIKSRQQGDNPLHETMFFWGLKGSLFFLAKELVKPNSN